MMTCRQVVVCVSLCLAGLASAAAASAAEPARELAAMNVKPGNAVYVRLVTGVDMSGRFVRATSQMLTMSVTDARDVSIPAAEIAAVWKRDGLRNGAIIGAIIGLAAAFGGQSECSDCTGAVALGVAVGVPFWAGVGALVDRQHAGRTLIYQAP